MKVVVRVQPGSREQAVGGERNGALLVRVRSPAQEGRATSEAIRALARALGIPPSSVKLVAGATSRTKTFDISGDPASISTRLATLRGISGKRPG